MSVTRSVFDTTVCLKTPGAGTPAEGASRRGFWPAETRRYPQRSDEKDSATSRVTRPQQRRRATNTSGAIRVRENGHKPIRKPIPAEFLALLEAAKLSGEVD